MNRREKVVFAKHLKAYKVLTGEHQTIEQRRQVRKVNTVAQNQALKKISGRQRRIVRAMASTASARLRNVGDQGALDLVQALGHLFVIRGIGDEIRGA